jgi:hypothetical protein
MQDSRSTRGAATVTFSVLMILIGIALIARTLAAGGGPLATGLILGVLFVAAGVGRIYLRRLSRR